MRKFIHIALAAALSIAIQSASAYNTLGHKATAIVAERCLTEKARSEILSILDCPMSGTPDWILEQRKAKNPGYDQKYFYFSLDDRYRCTTKSKDDGIVIVEKCVKQLRQRGKYSRERNCEALKMLMYLVCDMHSIAHVRMEAIPLSSRPSFNLNMSNGRPGKKHALSKCSWKKLWDGIYLTSHGSFSPQMYADDIEVCHGADKAEFSKGTPREWVEDMGREARPMYDWAGENVTVSRDLRNGLETDYYRCLSKGGYRLGALLNDIFDN